MVQGKLQVALVTLVGVALCAVHALALGVDVSNEARQQESRQNLEEIIVTAQKRDERLIDVPISVVAVTADELAKRNVTGIDDLPGAVPGLSIESSGGYARRIEIRGISNTFGTWSNVGVYVDEADATSLLSNQLNLNTYDLERVEVLRGPQGTLYGEGSAGGTIRFVTKAPNLDNFSFQSDVAALFTQDGAPSQRIQSAINLPVVADVLGFRIAGTFENDGGWIDQPAADRTNINTNDLTDVRAKGLWQPTSQLSISALLDVHRSTHGTNTGEDSNGDYTQQFSLTTSPRITDNFELSNLTASYAFGAVRLVNSSTYLDQVVNARNYGLVVPVIAPPFPALEDYLNPNDATIHAFTDELRLESSTSGPWQWTLGGFYRHLISSTYSAVYVGFPPSPLPAAPVAVTEADLSSKSSAAFANTSLKLFERLTLGAGVRYFRDEEVQDVESPPPPTAQSQTFSSTDPRAYLEFALSRNANVYASAAKGFRSGGFNLLGQPEFQPESVWTYELGTKMSLLSGTLDLDGAVFYSDYSNYQISSFQLINGTPQGITSNAGNAFIKGVELDLAWRPTDNWKLTLGGDELDTRFYRITESPASYEVGDPLDLVPKYQLTASVERDFSVGGKPGNIFLSYDQQGRETYRNRVIGSFFYSESDIIHMLNLNTSLNWSHNLTFGFFIQNLTNDRGYADPYSIQGFAARPRPRTLGVNFGMRLD